MDSTQAIAATKLLANDLFNIIEGAIFSSSVPLSVDAIAKFVSDETPKEVIRQALLQIQTMYETRGIRLVQVATGYRFQVANEVAPYIVKSMEERPSRYSRALLETLALIAYRQPITRGEIEDIRGVAVSTHIIKTLDEQEWIRIVGHKDVPGKPALYATTKAFLDHFGLKNLEDLPPLAELKDFESFSVPQSHDNAQDDIENGEQSLVEESTVSEVQAMEQEVQSEDEALERDVQVLEAQTQNHEEEQGMECEILEYEEEGMKAEQELVEIEEESCDAIA